jgi:DnaJ-class molecular chaperone
MTTSEIVTGECANCRGTGTVSFIESAPCPVCRGSGDYLEQTCLGCGGSGEVEWEDEEMCRRCIDRSSR